jgi:hypothetical protein
MRTPPDVLQILLDSDRHSLVKNKALPKPVGVSVLLLVVHNPTVQLKNVLEPAMPKQCGGLFTPDSARAVHQDLLVLVASQFLEVIRQLSEIVDFASNRILKFTGR